jgi:outer membrane protein assembly factor BamB
VKFRLVLVVTVLALSGGCATNDEVGEQPAELQTFEEKIEVRRIWSARLGGSSERLRLGLSPATDGARIYAGSYEGQAAAFDAETGRRIWNVQTNLPLSAGPTYGNGALAFGTTDGDLIVLDSETGEERWRRPVGAEVLAAPAIANDILALRSVDGRLRGYSAIDGRELWSVEQSVPALTMRGNTAPAISEGVVVTGFDNGRLSSYELDSGDPMWEIIVAVPSGRTELERLIDVSAGLKVVGGDVFAVGYHGRALAISLQNGLIIWQQEISSYSGLGVDLNSVYITDEYSEVVALDKAIGTPRWRQDGLRLRDVTAPSPYGNTIVVGDFEGYLHWLDPSDGSFIARERLANRPIYGTPLVVGANLFAQAEDGTLSAYTLQIQEVELEPEDNPA